MFRSRWRKIFRDVWARKSRTILASTAIFVGVLGVVTLWSSGDLLISQLSKDLNEDEMAMQQAFVSAPSGADVDNAAYLETLGAFPGVTRVEGRAVMPLAWKLPGEDKFHDAFVLAAWEPFDQIELQPMRVTGEGRYPVTGQKEIAVERRMADRQGLSVGDQLVLRVLGGDGGEESWTITGLVFTPYSSFTPAAAQVPGNASVFTTFEDGQYIAGFVGVNSFLVRYTDFATAEEQADRFYASIAVETPYVPVFNLVDNPAESLFITQVAAITNVLSMLGVIAMIVSGLLVANIINAVVGEQKRQIGVMKSLGATRWDNFTMYVGISLTYGVLGLIPGAALGAYLGSLMAQSLDELASTFVDGFSVSTSGIMIGVVMGLVVPFVAALIPVFLGTRVSILDAMTDTGISSNYGRGLLARAINIVPLPTNTKQAISNVTRKKGRLLLTWLTLTMAIAAFMGVYSVFASFGGKLAEIFDAVGYEALVVPNERQPFEDIRSVILDGVDGIENVYPGVGLAVEVEGYVSQQFGTPQLSMTGFDPSTDSFELGIESGTAWRDDPTREGIVLTFGVAKALGKNAGDTVTVAGQGRTVELEIIGIASFPFDQGFMEWQALARLVGSTTVTGEVAPTLVMVQMAGAEPSSDQVSDFIDEVEETLLAAGISASFVNQVAVEEEVAQQIAVFGLLFEIAALVMAAVGAIGLLSTLSMAVFERQREIGVMRSVGASSFTVTSQFLTEGMMVGVTAWIAAAPLSYLLGLGLIAVLAFDIEDIGYAPVALVIGLVGVVVITALASIGPSLGAARKTVSEILRYQ